MATFAAYAPLIGLIFFFVIFTAIAVAVLRPSAKKRIESLGEIPLKEDAHERR